MQGQSKGRNMISEDTHEKEIMMQAFAKVVQLFERREWIMQGRGSYPYNDDRYKEEVRYLYDEFEAIRKDTWANIKSKSFEYRQKIIEQYLKETTTPNNDQITAALRKFVSMHETGLLPNRFTYEEGKKALEGVGIGNDAIEFAEFLDSERNNKSDNWKDMNIWGKENAFKAMLKLWQQSKSK